MPPKHDIKKEEERRRRLEAYNGALNYGFFWGERTMGSMIIESVFLKRKKKAIKKKLFLLQFL